MTKIVTVTLRDQRISPKKARLVMRSIQGKKAADAKDLLESQSKKTSGLALKLLKSGIDAAQKKDFKEEELFIQEAIAQDGKRMKRYFIRARGKSSPYTKRMSHLKITLAKVEQLPTVMNKVTKQRTRKDKKNGKES
jgi:large subunit ribosomal protein L22